MKDVGQISKKKKKAPNYVSKFKKIDNRGTKRAADQDVESREFDLENGDQEKNPKAKKSNEYNPYEESKEQPKIDNLRLSS